MSGDWNEVEAALQDAHEALAGPEYGQALEALARLRAAFGGNWFCFDPDPIAEWYPAGGPILVGPFPTKFAAETYANQSHPEDMDGNTVVLQAVKP